MEHRAHTTKGGRRIHSSTNLMFDLDRFVGSGAVFSPCLPPPPTVPRHLVGDWEAFLALMGMREWMEGIQARVSTWGVLQHTHEYPSVLTKKTHDPTDAAARLPVRGGRRRAAPAPRWLSDPLIRHSAVSISIIASPPPIYLRQPQASMSTRRPAPPYPACSSGPRTRACMPMWARRSWARASSTCASARIDGDGGRCHPRGNGAGGGGALQTGPHPAGDAEY